MRRKRICLLAGMMVFVLMMILAVHFGNYPVRVREIGQVIGAHLRGTVYPDSNVDTIVWKIRLPRVLTAAMTGVLLSVSGAVFQGIFRNPLVEPYVLGVSSGAAFGAAACIVFSWTFISKGAAAFLFAMLAMALAYGFALCFPGLLFPKGQRLSCLPCWPWRWPMALLLKTRRYR